MAGLSSMYGDNGLIIKYIMAELSSIYYDNG